MKLLVLIERINRLHELIKHRSTGTPEELAKRLNLSTSMVYKVIEDLKLNSVPIEYSRQLRSYYYSTPYRMNITMDFHFLNQEDVLVGDNGQK